MKVMALDVSVKSTGWFVSKTSKGLIITDSKLSLGERLLYFRNEVLSLLRKYKPTVVVIEDTYFRMNIKTLKHLCMFHGVAREVCAQEKVEVEIMTATQARSFCCGKQQGEFKKQQVFDYFVSKFKWDDFIFDTHNDITDAAALFFGHREKVKAEQKKLEE